MHGYPGSDEAIRWARQFGRVTEDGDDGPRGYWTNLGGVEESIRANQAKLNAMQAPSLSGDAIFPTMNDYMRGVATIGDAIGRMSAVVAAVTAVTAVTAGIYSLAAQSYYELLFSKRQAELFEQIQSEIDARLTPIASGALDKIESITERLAVADPEAVSGAMNTCRRLIDSLADALFAARGDAFVVDGQPLAVKQGNVLNRLQAYASGAGITKGRRDRLRRTLNDIYGRVSAGVHSDVTADEARFLFLERYVVIGELLSLARDV